MTRAEETARVAALRAAFAASEEPDVFRWFARREDAGSDCVKSALIRAGRLLHFANDRSGIYDGILREIDAALANPQSAAEPPRDRTDFAWDVIGETEAF